MKIGITGGIGSGKSFVCKHLEARGYKVYDCDSAAKRLIRTSKEIRQRLTELIGKIHISATHLTKRLLQSFFLLLRRMPKQSTQ